ncbi:MlaD family protein [Paraflavisolibacter sp. H34]|uniref:MlaD family protein n=1 Tax=Huijunlia imazamoxiresistens TaxID=3127457 RepID=UPI0030174B87
MSATHTKQKVIVGLFVLVGLLIFLAGVLTLGGKRRYFAHTFTLQARFEDVGGLLAGNNIWLAGVKVGTVEEVRLSAGPGVEVTMTIDETARPFIRRDARVRIGSESFIGNRILVIHGGSPGAPPVADGALLATEKVLNMDDMILTFQQNNQNLLAITEDFKTISRRLLEGEGFLGKLMTDESLMTRLQATLNTLQKASGHAEDLTGSFAAYAAKLRTRGTLSNELVTDTVLFRSLSATVRQLQSVSEAATAITRDLKAASGRLDDPRNAAGLFLTDPQLAESLKATLLNLQSGTEKLDANMEALQHNFLFRGYFKKLKKQEEGK